MRLKTVVMDDKGNYEIVEYDTNDLEYMDDMRQLDRELRVAEFGINKIKRDTELIYEEN